MKSLKNIVLTVCLCGGLVSQAMASSPYYSGGCDDASAMCSSEQPSAQVHSAVTEAEEACADVSSSSQVSAPAPAPAPVEAQRTALTNMEEIWELCDLMNGVADKLNLANTPKEQYSLASAFMDPALHEMPKHLQPFSNLMSGGFMQVLFKYTAMIEEQDKRIRELQSQYDAANSKAAALEQKDAESELMLANLRSELGSRNEALGQITGILETLKVSK